MNNTAFRQYNETDPLRKVIIGRVEGYRKVEEYTEIVNEEQKKGLPEEGRLRPEFGALIAELEKRNIEVLLPDYVGKFVYDQLTPRDIGITIGNKFVLCNMKKSSRRYESAGIFRHILGITGNNHDILLPPDNDILLEGGDVMVDKQHLLVGISQRTNRAGFAFLQEHFGEEFEVIPVHCQSLGKGENVLHLDCTFNPVGKEHALIYPQGFKEIPPFIAENYRWIEVNAEEQAQLATNVLSLDEKTVISRNHPLCRRVNDEMRKAGLEVIEISFDGAPATGGSFRCCSLPLVR